MWESNPPATPRAAHSVLKTGREDHTRFTTSHKTFHSRYNTYISSFLDESECVPKALFYTNLGVF
ncbi:hypothetical protein DNHGIG_28490 [Collibacillus ludicampi]|uniref:Uncharacterized protein n=1 Tax=Collibacillus ludicampi TaxID=2771369 RepID=A0AAV4LHI0_9BACL|nr:hypothetical protein DNHGIG_28490 [Collibacillus ludicampi]